MGTVEFQKHLELVSEAAPQEELDLFARHDLYFETRLANTPELLRAVHALRFQVYCLERQFEKTEEHAGGMEVDAFDSHSAHGLLYNRLTGEAMGTVRVISPNNGSTQNNLPIIPLLRDSKMELADYVPIERTVEISRFAISKQLRRRLTDQSKSPGIAAPRSRFDRERQGNLPCLSLMQFMVRQSIAVGATHWAAVLEIKLLRMLASMGIRLKSIGPMVMHHGLRQPCYGCISEMGESLKQENYDYWRIVSDDGELAEKLKALG
jgi:N-acyl amino acid synthase of PEP-CTERM/exosortase system